MATLITNLNQSLAEIRTHYLDFSPDIPTGVTLVSAAATHIPPSGDAVTPVVNAEISEVAVRLGPLAVKGDHYVSVIATLSNGDEVEMRLKINVRL